MPQAKMRKFCSPVIVLEGTDVIVAEEVLLVAMIIVSLVLLIEGSERKKFRM